MNLIEKFNLDIFIKGESIDLCLPNADFAKNSSWYNWFNDQRVTRFLDQGVFPNTREDQLLFYNKLAGSSRVSFIISDKQKYVGTISLSSIDLVKKSAEIALLIGEKSSSPHRDMLALESMALITQYGFDKIGLKRIYAGQHVKLTNFSNWQQKLELLGYRLEGIKREGFVKSNEISDTILISCLIKDYEYIKKLRKGNLWDSILKFRRRIEKLPKDSFNKNFKNFLINESNIYYNQIFKL